MENKSFFRWFRFILSIPLFILLVSSPTGAQTEYPYKEVTPNYIEANTILSSLTGQDDASELVTLPFQFTFYGVPYPKAYVNTNGYLNFLHSYTYFTNKNTPRLGLPDGTIYAFWDDLAVPGDGSVRTEVLGTAPKRQFVIEWRNVTLNGDWVNRFDFEIVLHETGAILLQYRNIDIGTPEMGSSATIGLENQTGDAGVQFSFNTTALKSPEFAILFGKAEKNVPVDINPRRCPNPVNLVRKGVLRVAILGTADVPVSAIDPSTVTLQGIAPLRWRLEDVGTPYEPFVGKTDVYHCNNLGPDGYPDLIFKFDTEDVVGAGAGALGVVQAGQALLLKLDGKLLDGTEIKGEDSVVIIRGHHKWEKERTGHHDDRWKKDRTGHHKREDRTGHHKKEKDRDHKKEKDRDGHHKWEKDRDDDREDDEDDDD
jgi:hypothetical protein